MKGSFGVAPQSFPPDHNRRCGRKRTVTTITFEGDLRPDEEFLRPEEEFDEMGLPFLSVRA